MVEYGVYLLFVGKDYCGGVVLGFYYGGVVFVECLVVVVE